VPVSRCAHSGMRLIEARVPVQRSKRSRRPSATFLYQVPYTNQLAPVQAVGAQLLELSQEVRRRSGGFVRRDVSDPALHLLINLVTSTIMQCILDPPPGVTPRELLDELIRRVELWVRAPR
jgi:hypothetical protein